jgi:hypothetical protein
LLESSFFSLPTGVPSDDTSAFIACFFCIIGGKTTLTHCSCTADSFPEASTVYSVFHGRNQKSTYFKNLESFKPGF